MIRKSYCYWLIKLITIAGMSISACYAVDNHQKPLEQFKVTATTSSTKDSDEAGAPKSPQDLNAIGAVSARPITQVKILPAGMITKWSPRDRIYTSKTPSISEAKGNFHTLVSDTHSETDAHATAIGSSKTHLKYAEKGTTKKNIQWKPKQSAIVGKAAKSTNISKGNREKNTTKQAVLSYLNSKLAKHTKSALPPVTTTHISVPKHHTLAKLNEISESNSVPAQVIVPAPKPELTSVPVPIQAPNPVPAQTPIQTAPTTPIPIKKPNPLTSSLDRAAARSLEKPESSKEVASLPKVGIPATRTFTQSSNTRALPPTPKDDEIAQNFVRAPKAYQPFRQSESPALNTDIAQEAEVLPSAASTGERAPVLETAPIVSDKISIPEEAFINFNDISIVQYLNFISKLTGKNFIFDKADLDFNVTIISTKPTSIENVMATLLQELRVHNLSLMEVGNNLIIHRNDTTNSPGAVVGHKEAIPKNQDYITKVFLIENTPPQNLIDILHPLLSSLAIVESNPATNHLIITDIAPNIERVSEIIDKLDKPFTGSEVGQYVIRNDSVENVVLLLRQLMEPIAGDIPISIIPQTTTNSIFIVSSTHLVQKAMAILQRIDSTAGETRILSIQNLKKEEMIQPTPQPGSTQSSKQALSKQLQNILKKFLGDLSAAERLRLQNLGFDGNASKLSGSKEEQEAILNYLRSLSAQERDRLLEESMAQKQPEVEKTEDQKNEEYLTPEEKRYLNQATKAENFKFGKTQGSVLDQQDLFFNDKEDLGAVPAESKQGQWRANKPGSHLDSTEFVVIRLLNRKGDEIVAALRSLAEKLNINEKQPTELLVAINSIQLLESSNSLLVTGSPRSITKVRDLINQLDIPVRQVLVEMLIIRTSLNDSLTYGVDLDTRFGGGNTVGGNHSGLTQDTSLNSSINAATAAQSTLIPNFFQGSNFRLGVIGQNVHHGSLIFNSIGALVTALHTDNRIQVVLNPKIVVEDNHMAEIFVGQNTAYTTEAITSSQNNQITQSVEYRDVGTSLKVTPRIRHNDVITLEIEQEISDEATASNTSSSSSTNQIKTTASSSSSAVTNVGPTTNKSKTKTVVHLPNEYFLILSGMMQKQESQVNTQVPCVGGIPILGGLFKSRGNQDTNSNLMIFIRPTIIDAQNMHEETKRQQDLFREKTRNRHRGEYETDEAMDYFNLKETYEGVQE